MNKVIRDGKVAVLVSKGYGAGWSTWRSVPEEFLFDEDIVHMVMRKEAPSDIKARVKEKWPDDYFGGVSGLVVEWVEKGTLFRINEYDGYEEIEYLGNQDWITA